MIKVIVRFVGICGIVRFVDISGILRFVDISGILRFVDISGIVRLVDISGIIDHHCIIIIKIYSSGLYVYFEKKTVQLFDSPYFSVMCLVPKLLPVYLDCSF